MTSQITEVTSSYGGHGFASGPIHMPDPVGPAETLPAFDGRDSIKCPFDLEVDNEQLKVTDGIVYIGSSGGVEVDGLTIGRTFTGTVYLKISWSSSGGFTGELTTTNPGTGDDFVVRKLYDFEGGKANMDYRNTPVFVLYN